AGKAHGAGRDPPLRAASRRLHGAEAGGVPRRAAEDRLRQDQPAAGRGGTGARRMSDVMERPQLAFSADALRLDAAAATDEITAAIRAQVSRTLRKRGVVLGLSGGIDSSVAAALCPRAPRS